MAVGASLFLARETAKNAEWKEANREANSQAAVIVLKQALNEHEMSDRDA